MSSNPDMPDADDALRDALRARRKHELSLRSQPDDSATGTSRIAERLAVARAEARRKPRQPKEVIDLT